LRALPLQNLAHCWIAKGRAGFFSDFILPAHRIYSYGSHLISVSSRHCAGRALNLLNESYLSFRPHEAALLMARS
jgi:hypothetical protein